MFRRDFPGPVLKLPRWVSQNRRKAIITGKTSKVRSSFGTSVIGDSFRHLTLARRVLRLRAWRLE